MDRTIVIGASLLVVGVLLVLIPSRRRSRPEVTESEWESTSRDPDRPPEIGPNGLIEYQFYEGVPIEIRPQGRLPTADDLLQLQGTIDDDASDLDPRYRALESLGIRQVDDYYGLWNPTEEGDVIVWLYPVVDGEDVYHHSGPYEALRFSYSPLDYPEERRSVLFSIVRAFAKELDAQLTYRDTDYGSDVDAALERLSADIDAIVQYWRDRGIECGSYEARKIGL